MKLIELLKVINLQITLEISGLEETFINKSDIPDEWMKYEVVEILVRDNGIIVKLVKPRKAALEKLGYSFEAGM
ncbi:MAG: hypothetical protein PHZ11_11150 [Desulfitobacteriaceae bacterium]|jgi:hypothetical protein|nr:hypothetical protein [Desulfitobacteriaceae bacterium]MDD4347407.1 hypothetical protein [Desulfitobacteriaceae bacterium]MDD4401861.1 hypothetical protein [Desulfitobacteriaceae bacterium]